MIIGVLSDTHADIHPGVVPLFRGAGVELILHAGDVGRYDVIDQLRNLAPVQAVRGNVDKSGRVSSLPETLRLEFEGVSILMTHIGGKPEEWSPRLPAPRPDVAICGHSHAPLLASLDGTLFLNPGAAGVRKRFGLPFSAAILTVEKGKAEAQLFDLDVVAG
jgi:uncharacterized protein